MRNAVKLDTSGSTFTWWRRLNGYAITRTSFEPDVLEVLAGEKPLEGLAIDVASEEPPESVRTREQFEAWRAARVSTYAPASVPGLHRKFAEAESSPAAALDFCDRYGLPEHPITRPYFLSEFYAAQDLVRGALARKRKTVVAAAFNANSADFRLRLNGAVVEVVPRSLLGFMLLAVFREMRGSEWRECVICGTPFEVLDGRQDRQQCCSPRCRQKRFRDSRG